MSILSVMRYGIIAFVLALFPLYVGAQQVFQEMKEVVPATVLEVLDQREEEIFGTGTMTEVQDILVRLEGGARAGEEVSFENDLVMLEAGDKIFINRLETIDGTTYYTFKDVNRKWPLLTLTAVFVGLLLWFAGWQGIRALVSLMVSVAAVLFLLVPALLAGYDPALASLLIASIVLAAVLYGTHGFSARSSIAFGGTLTAVVVTCGLAAVWVGAMRLTGFADDAAVYLNFSTGGSLDFAGLLLGSIIIGVLGVLDDVAITQAAVVQELKHANATLSGFELYRRAIRVGRDHVGSLVNTLALAYVGASLPLVLLMARTESDFFTIINQEIVAAEYVRIIIGSIGLVLTVPLTTALAAWWWHNRTVDEVIDVSHGHHHHH